MQQSVELVSHQLVSITYHTASVPQHCWLDDKKGIRPMSLILKRCSGTVKNGQVSQFTWKIALTEGVCSLYELYMTWNVKKHLHFQLK